MQAHPSLAARKRVLGLVALAASLTACHSEPPRTEQESYVFGTRVVITVVGTPAPQARTAIAEALAELDQRHARLHPWQAAGSEVVALNAALAAGQAAPVSPVLAELIAASQHAEALSDGYFNPAIGQLVALWGFHADSFTPRQPNAARLATLLARQPSMAAVVVTEGHARSRNPAVALDLGGIAKGWALDRVAHRLRQQGIQAALINIGGNVLALGAPEGRAWKVGIQHPRAAEAMAVVSLADGEAIGTSGDYQRYFEWQGTRYCHLIDPHTGRADCPRQAATVLVERGEAAGLRSDTATKALFFAPTDRVATYADRFKVRAVLRLEADGHAEISPYMATRLTWLKPPAVVTPLPHFPSPKTAP